ncbi:hypothetical protein [uncultured Thomasclavelia sp.]|uniref:hypothetical protein n=1 Tax=uncultured Thomasclavelia sp. TaxID=3025759 RepID=UPI0026127CC2|nr:hypothetical protein [uncultured Thomasclavelia sp.]
MKRILIIIFTIFTLMSITGCNNTANNSKGDTGSSSDTNENTTNSNSTYEDEGKISEKEYKKLIQMQKDYNAKELYTKIEYDHNKNEIDMISVGNSIDMSDSNAFFYFYDVESDNFYLVDAEVDYSWYVYNANEDKVYYRDSKEIEKGYHTMSDYIYKPYDKDTYLLGEFQESYNKFLEKYQIDDISEVEYYLEKRLAARLQYGPYAPEGEKQEE